MATYKFKTEKFADKQRNDIELSKTQTVKEVFTIKGLESELASIERAIASHEASKTVLEKKIADAKKALSI